MRRVVCQESAVCRAKQDRPPSLAIYPTTGTYFCFRCHATGKLDSLAHTRVGTLRRVDKVTLDSTDSPTPNNSLIPSTFPLNSIGIAYLRLRGIRERIWYAMGVCQTERGLLFPFPDSEYWQERRWDAFRPPPWKNSGPRPDGLVYEVNLFPDSRQVAVVEGVMDALAVGHFMPAAAILTNRVGEDQAEYLGRHYNRCMFLPDGDVPPDLVQQGALTLRGHLDVDYRQLAPHHDPAYLHQQGNLEWVIQ